MKENISSFANYDIVSKVQTSGRVEEVIYGYHPEGMALFSFLLKPEKNYQ